MNPNKSLLRVALYARVSSERQAEANTIASQVAALHERIANDGYAIAEDDCFIDDGASGFTLTRPGLERLRDQVAYGVIDRLYVLAPDRLARKAAYQAVLTEEFKKAGIELVFLNHSLGKTPEDDLLLQVQGVIAEYERAKIMERSRRGKLHAARQGRVSVLTKAPFGYRYVSTQEGGGQARYEIVAEEARIVQQMFAWVAQEHLSIREVCRRLEKQQVRTRKGLPCWSSGSVATLLKNPAFIGQAAFGKTRMGPWSAGLRPRRGKPAVPRRPCSVSRKDTNPITIAVPAVVSRELFEAANEQLAENRRRYRQARHGASFLLQGLLVCPQCGYAWCGQSYPCKKAASTQGQTPRQDQPRGYYRCTSRWRPAHLKQKEEGKPFCLAKQIRTDQLDEAVWRDVCALLQQPQRIEEEYERRLQAGNELSATSQSLQGRLAQLKRGIARLIDAYGEGLLEKEEFEPKIRHMKERLGRLQEEEKGVAQEEAQRAELRLVIGQIEEFTKRMEQGLQEADWGTRREIIRALVKQIEVSGEQVRIVYRVNTVPFVQAPSANGGILQDCRRRPSARQAILLLLFVLPFLAHSASLCAAEEEIRRPRLQRRECHA